jgi:hypothetical protein
MYTPPYLQPYKGNASRFTCPSCETKHSFTLYLDGSTNEPINAKVGKCNRESKCGYHYTPKQFFIDNPSDCRDARLSVSNKTIHIPKQIAQPQPPGTIPFSYVERSASYKSNFVRFLFDFLTDEQIEQAYQNYALGSTKTNEVIFWQIDINGKVRTGKIMQYNPTTGRRIKHESGAIDWVHNKLKKAGALPEDFNLQQCFFGEHLLKIYPQKPLAIVESEKSAIIASVVIPDSVWIAAGQLNGLSIEKAKILQGRNVTLFPDLGGFEKWRIKANEIKQSIKCEIKVSTILEDIATETQRSEGLDIADYIIDELKAKVKNTVIQSRFSQKLQSMTEQNPALLILIDRLELEEITR